ncbi:MULTISPECIES: hypothetical protein [Acinetobacter]|uniref:Uncharacterized protein n=1 Tax=Acinetobacter piscicola TaxID=2006115 RepID=A0A4Q4H3C6_9GAMM|nr:MULTISPECIES: hypothetical protein [Acinetobacter]MDM1758049.1 hypothetical protein [Acinetobacter sp. 256-1]MDM1761182.1 hypothetical protein [Acinetobacter sp. 251-1]QOW46394.1 hypothetical protein G0028_11080 [Acinetobacter piscicola]RYL27781.1 hypothetical protein EWP19_06185 [Acinetobacter piscicola]
MATFNLQEYIEQIKLEFRKVERSSRLQWLFEHYPISAKDYYIAYFLIASDTWKKFERKAILEYYLQTLPHASDQYYLKLLKVIPLAEFIEVVDQIKTHLDDSKLDLLNYYLEPIIKNSTGNIDE